MDPLLCEWDTAQFLIFSENVFSPLIYYSHLAPTMLCLALGVFILVNNPRQLINRILFAITFFFSLWCFFDLILWASEKIELIMFFWALIVPVELMIYASAWYLVSVFARGGTDITMTQKVLAVALFIPIFLFTHTSLNLLGFDLTNCDRAAIEGPLVQYLYIIELFFIGWIIKNTISGQRMLQGSKRRQLRFVSIGVTLFLVAFSAGNLVISYFFEMDWFDWSYEQYKLFGMPIFVAFITYSAIKLKTFNTKVITSQALVIAVSLLVLSLLFPQTIGTVRIIAGITFVLASILGYILIKNIKLEIKQREQIEELAQNLEVANVRLKELDRMKSEFVSIASHQLRSPLTSIRGYASMLAEGSYGKFPAKAQDILEKIIESGKFMALSIEDYLNVSRIEAGNMKYELSDFDMKKLAEDVVDELRQSAMKKGLVLIFRSDCTGKTTVHADIGKTRQVISNLIDNSIKYTPKGTITVLAHNDKKKGTMTVSIHDTGVGMSTNTLEEVFEKFVRAKNANSVNVTGTGLGLYVAKIMVEQMKGKVWAESEGEGTGSTFRVEFPLV